MKNIKITFAVCTYNRSSRLSHLLKVMSSQQSVVNFEILVVDNNSTDATQEVVLEKIKTTAYPPIRLVKEASQGIVFARNRAIEESVDSDYLIFIDDDELPHPGYLQAAIDSFSKTCADVVGGRINVNFGTNTRPKWLSDDLLKSLASLNYGDKPFFITDKTKPLWTSNIAYRTVVFKEGLRFDKNYNREGYDVGGGEDEILFRNLIDSGKAVMYQPQMVTDHFVEPWRLKRRYFYLLNYKLGFKEGMFATPKNNPSCLGVPRYVFRQFIVSIFNTLNFKRKANGSRFSNQLRVCYFWGCIIGCYKAGKATTTSV